MAESRSVTSHTQHKYLLYVPGHCQGCDSVLPASLIPEQSYISDLYVLFSLISVQFMDLSTEAILLPIGRNQPPLNPFRRLNSPQADTRLASSFKKREQNTPSTVSQAQSLYLVRHGVCFELCHRYCVNLCRFLGSNSCWPWIKLY